MPAKAAALTYDAAELAADRLIHQIGLTLGFAGAPVLLALAARRPPGVFVVSLIYAASLLAMLVCSANYHLAIIPARRAFWRRLDHAVIFLLIAGTYTPFTAWRLHGAWAVGMTAAVWTGALCGVTVKFVAPLRSGIWSTAAYIALGWIVLAGIRPILDALDSATLSLIALGGAIYSLGSGVHHWRSLRFHNAIWHAMVLMAAVCHFTAVLHGVVLAG